MTTPMANPPKGPAAHRRRPQRWSRAEVTFAAIFGAVLVGSGIAAALTPDNLRGNLLAYMSEAFGHRHGPGSGRHGYGRGAYADASAARDPLCLLSDPIGRWAAIQPERSRQLMLGVGTMLLGFAAVWVLRRRKVDKAAHEPEPDEDPATES